ncbi:plasma membrane calcium [Ascosphaera acerosa]|nr:plasma membrane calcium [Ascosphaera acerosa]
MADGSRNKQQIPTGSNLAPDRPSYDSRSNSSHDGGSFLSPHSPTSLGGDTLQRSRSSSCNSHVETLQPLSRDGSNVSATEVIQQHDGTGMEKPAHGFASKGPKGLAYDDVDVADALKPDERDAADFLVTNNPFAFSPGQLNKLLNPKSLAAYHALGGIRGLERGLRTDLSTGLSIDESRLDGCVTFEQATSGSGPQEKPASDPRAIGAAAATGRTSTLPLRGDGSFTDRVRVFDRNKLPDRQTAGFFKLLWDAYNDKIIILLTIAAVISLSLGIYEAVDGGSSADWIEGVAIVVAILIVTIVTAANDWQKERQFVTLNKRKSDREVKAIRSGKSVLISIFDVTVGDILHLEPGDAIPADGILLSGYGVKCDESSATGESDMMKKTPGQEVWDRIMSGTATKKDDPFIISGSTVLEGVGTYLVTSVGPNSSYGKIMLSLQTPNDPTPLQVKLSKLADYIGYLGTAAATVLFLVLFIRFLVQLPNDGLTAPARGRAFLDVLIVAITVIVVAIPEGLPLAVTLALAFATTRMVKENNLVRILRACETMGNATVICSDKTGTLTQNKMTVVAGKVGLDQDLIRGGSAGIQETQAAIKEMSRVTRQLLVQGIAVNSTAFEGEENGRQTFIGSKTEVAMLGMLQTFFGLDLATERANANVVQLIPFDSQRKCMGVVVQLPSGLFRLYVKGAAELMLEKASHVVSGTSQSMLAVSELSRKDRAMLSDTIVAYSKRSLRNIGMLYKDFQGWPPIGAGVAADDSAAAEFADVFHDMIWVGVVGIQDPLRPEVPHAIEQCNKAGVAVKMVTGDNLNTAIAISEECGIKTADGIAMEGPVFRKLSDEEMDKVLPRLQVLARSSPEDKRILVGRLKHLGETVAVTGDGTNDGPALKTADVGFSMGIGGTEVAKEASAIILLDDNFKSIVTAISWGRAVNDAVAKFLQFQVTVNITAVVLTFVSAVANNDNKSVLTAVQLLWVNLIMDTFAALALATDAPTPEILNRKPTPKSAPLFTTTMWKMIIGQAIYQLVVTFVLYFAGAKILGYDVAANEHLQKELDTIVFNTFVWMQIFNEFNNRRLDNHFNIFEGALKNYWLLGITALMVGGQILIVFVGGEALQVVRIDGDQWAISIVCGFCCIPFGMLLRVFPDAWMAKVIRVATLVFNFFWDPAAQLCRFLWWPFRKVGHGVRRLFRRGGSEDVGEAAAPGVEKKKPLDEEANLSSSTQPATESRDHGSDVGDEKRRENSLEHADGPYERALGVPAVMVHTPSTHSLQQDQQQPPASVPPLPALTVTDAA